MLHLRYNIRILLCKASLIVIGSEIRNCALTNPSPHIAIFPGRTDLNILRTLNPTQSPLNAVSYLGGTNGVLAQLFYDGTETFTCAANNCTQSVDANTNAVDWQCSNLKCTCLPGSTFCGGAVSPCQLCDCAFKAYVMIPNQAATDLTTVIDGLDGNLGIACDPPANGTSSCSFAQSVLQQLFGASGLSLSECSFGECVQNTIVSGSSNATSTTSAASGSSSLDGGVIAGLAVVGALLLLALLAFLLGLRTQHKAKNSGATGLGGGISRAERQAGVGIAWSNVGYSVRRAGSRKMFGRSKAGADFDDGKVILNGVTGRIQPGEMMAILGPSGQQAC